MTGDDDAEPGMIRERATLPDGRYVVFYSFDDDGDVPQAATAVPDV
jgi:hypothetical protein